VQAIILVGGRGTRLQPLTDTRPKPMLPIVSLPYLEHQLGWLKRHGVKQVTFACGFMPQPIVAHFGDGASLGMQLEYVVEPEPLGTGGAIGFAARHLDADEIVVCNGDVLTELDLTELIAFHHSHSAVATIALTPVEDPSRYGLVRCSDGGEVLAFLEKPEPEEIDTNLINAGTYVLSRAVLDSIPADGPCSIERDIFPNLVGRGLHAMGSDGYWNDVGTPESYLAANIDMLRGRITGAGVPMHDSAAFIDQTAATAVDVQLHPPLFLGPGCRIASGATVGPDAVIGAGVVVESGARIVRSVVLERAAIGRDAQIVSSIVGEDAVVADRCSVTDGAVVAPRQRIDQTLLKG
jgi:mannose-1-phosphate guanylyltransferase